MTAEFAVCYLAGAYTALLTTPPGWAVIVATLVAVGIAEAVTP